MEYEVETITVWMIPAEQSARRSYRVTLRNGKYQCTCQPFRRRKKRGAINPSCHHIDEASRGMHSNETKLKTKVIP